MRIAELFFKTNDQYHSLIWLLLEGPIFRHISAQFGTTLLCCAANILKFIYIYIYYCVLLCCVLLCCVLLCCVLLCCILGLVLHCIASKRSPPPAIACLRLLKSSVEIFFAKMPQKNPVCPTSEYFWFRQDGEQLDYKCQSVHALFTTTCHARGN